MSSKFVTYLSRPLETRGEAALSFLCRRVSRDSPAIFQLPSTSLQTNGELVCLFVRTSLLTNGAFVRLFVRTSLYTNGAFVCLFVRTFLQTNSVVVCLFVCKNSHAHKPLFFVCNNVFVDRWICSMVCEHVPAGKRVCVFVCQKFLADRWFCLLFVKISLQTDLLFV